MVVIHLCRAKEKVTGLKLHLKSMNKYRLSIKVLYKFTKSCKICIGHSCQINVFRISWWIGVYLLWRVTVLTSLIYTTFTGKDDKFESNWHYISDIYSIKLKFDNIKVFNEGLKWKIFHHYLEKYLWILGFQCWYTLRWVFQHSGQKRRLWMKLMPCSSGFITLRYIIISIYGESLHSWTWTYNPISLNAS